MAFSIASAYVDILPKVDTGQFTKSAKQAGQSYADKFTGEMDRVGGKVSGVIGKGLKVGAAVGIAAVGTALVKGFGRLKAIDDARAKLRGLGHDSASVETIMTSALDSVKGTAFGLGDAATIAAGAVAAGIEPGEQLTRTLKITGDAAAIAGISLDEMGSIFNKVAANGKMTTEELNQLQDRGIPVLQYLQEEYGVTAEEARKMVSDGKVDFETFQSMLEDNIGGAAVEMGNSFSGALANMGAAAGRLGATVLTGLGFESLTDLMGGATGIIDNLTERVGPLAESFGSWLADTIKNTVVPAFQTFVGFIQDRVVPVIKTVIDFLVDNRETIGRLVAAIGPAVAAVLGFAAGFHKVLAVWKLIKAATPIGMIMALVAALIYAYQNSETFRNVVHSIVDAFKAVPGPVWQFIAVFAGVIGAVMGAMKVFAMLKTAFAAVKGAFIALKVAMLANPFVLLIAAVVALVTIIVLNWDTIKEYLSAAWNWIKETATAVWNSIKEFFTNLWSSITSGVTSAWESIKDFLSGVMNAIAGFFSSVWNGIKSTVTSVINGIKSIINAVFNAIKTYITTVLNVYKTIFTTVWNTIKSVVTGAVNGVKSIITSVMNGIKSLITTVWNGIKSTISNVLNGIKSIVTNVWNGIKAVITGVVNGIKSTVSNVFNSIKSVMGTAANTAKSLVSNAFNAMKSAVSSAISNLLGTVRGIPGRIKSALGNTGSMLLDAGKAIIRGLIRGITNMAGRVKDAVKGVLDKARNLLPFSPAKEGPFSGKGWTLYSGQAISEALAQGIEGAGGDAVSAARRVAGKTSDALSVEGSINSSAGRYGPGRGTALGAGAAGGTNFNGNIYVTIDAKSVQEMQDVTEFFGRVRQVARAGSAA